MTTRPPFRQSKPAGLYNTPEELFYGLSGRDRTHAYLRGPQQDVLREYVSRANERDIAFELPTGTGKTTVGLVIAEWKRRTGQRVAYLTLTNQLAGQVLAEAKRLGIDCADLRGGKNQRDPAEEGRFRTGSALGISSYSNLFNINPVVEGCDFIVFDDAHGGEQYVSGMWSVSVEISRMADIYNALLIDLKSVFSESQFRSLQDRSASVVDLADICSDKSCVEKVSATLDPVSDPAIKFPWREIRNRIRSCVVLVSPYEITIRPLVAPTHTHAAFTDAKQRVYMSATLGGESDLQRAYGIEKLSIVRAQGAQWGKRYVFIPELHTDGPSSYKLLGRLWDGMKAPRAALLAPSDRLMNHAFEVLQKYFSNKFGEELNNGRQLLFQPLGERLQRVPHFAEDALQEVVVQRRDQASDRFDRPLVSRRRR